MKTVKDFVFKGKRVLVRCDFNVPVAKNRAILDDFKIRRSLPTIKYLLSKKARIVLMSHLGDPKGKVVAKLSLAKVSGKLEKFLRTRVFLIKSYEKKQIIKAPADSVILLENLRFCSEEERGGLGFAKKLARLGDIFLNDAFACSHRNHASFKVAKYLACGAGLLLEKEIKVLGKFLHNSRRPLVIILGGQAKGIETKIKLLKSISQKADFILLGNLVAEELKRKGFKPKFSEKMVFPADSNQGLDIGPKTIKMFKEKIFKAKTVFWSGPLGKIEEKQFSFGSKEIAQSIIKSRAFSIVGGGETTWFLRKQGLAEKFNHLSTGGDALLMFLSGEKLPAIEILNHGRDKKS